jgi:hypothetical protein
VSSSARDRLAERVLRLETEWAVHDRHIQVWAEHVGVSPVAGPWAQPIAIRAANASRWAALIAPVARQVRDLRDELSPQRGRESYRPETILAETVSYRPSEEVPAEFLGTLRALEPFVAGERHPLGLRNNTRYWPVLVDCVSDARDVNEFGWQVCHVLAIFGDDDALWLRRAIWDDDDVVAAIVNRYGNPGEAPNSDLPEAVALELAWRAPIAAEERHECEREFIGLDELLPTAEWARDCEREWRKAREESNALEKAIAQHNLIVSSRGACSCGTDEQVKPHAAEHNEGAARGEECWCRVPGLLTVLPSGGHNWPEPDTRSVT